MSRESLIILLGTLIAFMPYLGIPSDWKRIVYVAAGILLMIFGYSLRRAAFFRSIETAGGERQTESYAENRAVRPRRSESKEVTV